MNGPSNEGSRLTAAWGFCRALVMFCLCQPAAGVEVTTETLRATGYREPGTTETLRATGSRPDGSEEGVETERDAGYRYPGPREVTTETLRATGYREPTTAATAAASAESPGGMTTPSGMAVEPTPSKPPLKSSRPSEIEMEMDAGLYEFISRPSEIGMGMDSGLYEFIRSAFDGKHEEYHATDFDSDSKATRELSRVVHPGVTPASATNTEFTLLRVAPFSGVNPFNYRSVRLAVEAAQTPGASPGPGGGNLCTPGPLSTNGFPLIAFPNGYLDVDASANSMTARDTGSASNHTALAVSKPNTVDTTFTTGPGWQAVTPSLPVTYTAGSVSFILRRADSGDYYSLQVTIQPGSMAHLTTPVGTCCGQGGCP